MADCTECFRSSKKLSVTNDEFKTASTEVSSGDSFEHERAHQAVADVRVDGAPRLLTSCADPHYDGQGCQQLTYWHCHLSRGEADYLRRTRNVLEKALRLT